MPSQRDACSPSGTVGLDLFVELLLRLRDEAALVAADDVAAHRDPAPAVLAGNHRLAVDHARSCATCDSGTGMPVGRVDRQPADRLRRRRRCSRSNLPTMSNRRSPS